PFVPCVLLSCFVSTIDNAHIGSHACRFFFYCYGSHRDLHSFPTRRSSDLFPRSEQRDRRGLDRSRQGRGPMPPDHLLSRLTGERDRKSTRLNSSNEWSSYTKICFKKKIHTEPHIQRMAMGATD